MRQPPVSRILVPGNEAGVIRFLDEEVGRPAQDIGSDQVLDRIDDSRVMHELVCPGEKQMRLVAPVSLQRLARDGFVRLERLAVLLRLGGRHHAHRRVEAVAAESVDGGLR